VLEALGKDHFIMGKVPGLPVRLRLRLASPRPLLFPMPMLVEARDGGTGGTGGARRHSWASAPTWASWSCTDTYIGTMESYDADAGYFLEGSLATRLHPKQLLQLVPTRGISTMPQKVSTSCSKNGVVGDWILCWMMDVSCCFDCVLCFFIFWVYVWI
jgi:hypothetical protein